MRIPSFTSSNTSRAKADFPNLTTAVVLFAVSSNLNSSITPICLVISWSSNNGALPEFINSMFISPAECPSTSMPKLLSTGSSEETPTRTILLSSSR